DHPGIISSRSFLCSFPWYCCSICISFCFHFLLIIFGSLLNFRNRNCSDLPAFTDHGSLLPKHEAGQGWKQDHCSQHVPDEHERQQNADISLELDGRE